MSLIDDIRRPFRSSARAASFTLMVAALLSLAMAGNISAFQIVNAVFFKPLPFPDPERLVRVDPIIYYEDYMEYFSETSSMDTAFTGRIPMLLEDVSFAEYIRPEIVTGNYFNILGVRPTIGGLLSPLDDQAESSGALVMSDSYWQRRFGRDPEILGKFIVLGGNQFQVVGVADTQFRGSLPPYDVDMWVVWNALPTERRPYGNIIGRMKPGAGLEQVRIEIDHRAREWNTQRSLQNSSLFQPSIERMRVLPSELMEYLNRYLIMLFTLSGLLLLISCASLGCMVLSRSLARRHEIATRIALGAQWRHIVRMFVAENIVLSLGGIVGALIISHVILSWMVRTELIFLAFNGFKGWI